jgi:hypothetical protein
MDLTKKKELMVKYEKLDKEMLKGFPLPDYNSDNRNSIPTSDRISGVALKNAMPRVKLPEGKTIGVAYNKGNYQIVDKADFKTMGKKI